jgi:hypothetical protein
MNKTFTSMKTAVGNNVQDTSSPMLSLIGGYLNDRLNEVRQRLKHSIIQTGRFDYSVSVSTEDIVLPDDVQDIVSVLDKTNLRPIEETTPQAWVEQNYSSIDTSGTVNSYFIYDSVVRTQPTSAGAITVVSDSAADTTQTVYVNGINSSGRQVDETITLTGTSSASGSVSFARILGISKSAATTGTVTVTTGSDTLAYFSPDQTTHYVRLMRFVKAPSSAFTCEIIYTQKMLPMVNDYDYPNFDCCDVLEAGATADAWRYKRQNAKASDWEQIYEKRLANIAFDMESRPNRTNLFNPITYPRNIV